MLLTAHTRSNVTHSTHTHTLMLLTAHTRSNVTHSTHTHALMLLTAHTRSKTPLRSHCLWSDSCHLCPLHSGSLQLASCWCARDTLPDPPFCLTVSSNYTHIHRHHKRWPSFKGSQEKLWVNLTDLGSAADTFWMLCYSYSKNTNINKTR